MKRILIRAGLLLVPICLIGMALTLWALGSWRPVVQSTLFSHTVYAYRQWQSTGYYLNEGDEVLIRAQGQWSYSPEVGENGPEGGPPAPNYYPLPSSPGGALLGRIGEDGTIFDIGPGARVNVTQAGMLYVGINDDLLGDNKGQLGLEITVIAPTATAAP